MCSTQSTGADVKGSRVDVKGYRVDVKGYRVDVKGYRVDEILDWSIKVKVIKAWYLSPILSYT